MVRILLASSEVEPFSKSGGLAEVCGALPAALARLGHDVAIITPGYPSARERASGLERLPGRLDIPVGDSIVTGGLLRTELPHARVPVYLVEQAEYFGRAGFYGEGGADYHDNCQRFSFFSRAVLEAVRLLELEVDVIHCNDWQTGLVPACLNAEYRHTVGYERIATVFTIHNLSFQGQFPADHMPLTGLDWKYFNWQQMEAYGQLNLLKTGLVFADAITAVSPTYAREIQTPAFGCGLEGVLAARADALVGILNGVDVAAWNPAADPHLAANFGLGDWQGGKAACKAALERELKLPEAPRTPLVGLIGRLTEQKGWDLVIELMDRWAGEADVQWAVLGSGEEKYRAELERLAAAYPNRVAARFEFSEPLAHRIEAGADIFVMASRFEPCGLNQMYSQRYGTIPVVRRTGGLADTVTNADARSLETGEATGYVFDAFTADALEGALTRATETYRYRPGDWRQIVETGMRRDWSWEKSARSFAELCGQLIAAR